MHSPRALQLLLALLSFSQLAYSLPASKGSNVRPQARDIIPGSLSPDYVAPDNILGRRNADALPDDGSLDSFILATSHSKPLLRNADRGEYAQLSKRGLRKPSWLPPSFKWPFSKKTPPANTSPSRQDTGSSADSLNPVSEKDPLLSEKLPSPQQQQPTRQHTNYGTSSEKTAMDPTLGSVSNPSKSLPKNKNGGSAWVSRGGRSAPNGGHWTDKYGGPEETLKGINAWLSGDPLT